MRFDNIMGFVYMATAVLVLLTGDVTPGLCLMILGKVSWVSDDIRSPKA